MISAKIRYETHDAELLAIVEAFKTWRHYLEGCKHEVLVLTNHNNLRRFMDTKSLSSRQILHRLQSSLTRASLSGPSIGSEANLLTLHRIFICGIYVLSQLRQFWETFRTELADENPYKASIGGMRMGLPELQESDEEVRRIRAARELQNGYKEIDGVLHYQGLPFVPEVIRTELISRHHDDPLAGHFGIDKTRELIGRKYY